MLKFISETKTLVRTTNLTILNKPIDVVKGWNEIFRNTLDEHSLSSAEKQTILDNFIIAEGD